MTLAFVFPGQGSQSIGMLKGLAESFPGVQKTFSEASTVLGYDLWQLTQDGPEERLNSTDVTQPAMLTAGVACWRVWRERGGAKPILMAGHSLGEYTALVCADALSFTDAVALVQERGQLMQAAVPAGHGAMAAILGLEDSAVRDVCSESAQGDVVEAVNFNSPGQVVIAGSISAVERAVELAKSKGAKRALILPVSVPSHCSLMKPAATKLAERLNTITIRTPAIEVINNVDVDMAADPDAIRKALARQLYQPVRWVETIEKMHSKGIDKLVECGPGKVLTGLNKRIVKEMNTFAVYDSDTLSTALN